MKKLVLILVLGFIFINSAYSQKYFGKSYPRTENVDLFFDNSDVKKAHIIMGQAELDQGFRSLQKSQQKMIDLAKKNGADGIIFSLVEDVYGSSTSSGGNINTKKKDKTTVTGSSSTVELTKKRIFATLIKYID